jgi:hypothetical protein
MRRQLTARLARASTTTPSAAVVLGIVLPVAAFGWFVTIAPAAGSFAIAVAAAMTWAAWLEKRPVTSIDIGLPTQEVVTAATRDRLSVHVLATTREGTRWALTIAKRLTTGLDGRVVLLVPRLVSFATRFDPAGPERPGLVDQHRALAAAVGVHVDVLFCVCQRYDDVVRGMLGRSSLLIVGGRKRIWWPTREERLVSRLDREGYPVVFAHVAARRRREQVPVAEC